MGIQYSGAIMLPQGGFKVGRLGPIAPTFDPYWDNVVFYSRFNDSNAIDETGRHTPTLQTGVSITSEDSKFGGSCVKLTPSANSGIYGGANADFAFGTGEWTVESWFKMTQMTTVTADGHDRWPIMDFRTGGANPIVIEMFKNSNGTDPIHFVCTLNGYNFYSTAAPNFQMNTWYHFAISKNSGVSRVFIDGVKYIEQSDTYNYTHNILRIGDNADTTTWDSAHGRSGYFDEFRITKGVGRYTEDFNVQFAEHPNKGTA